MEMIVVLLMAMGMMMMTLHDTSATRVEIQGKTSEHPQHQYNTICKRADKSLTYFVCFVKQLRFRNIVYHTIAQYTHATRGELHAKTFEKL
jgi:hypothetical protein